uniref:Uridine kinase n=1 Tax=Lotharella globosa TaxID=91324 RepID=A0A7S3Z9K3_9EUKA
MAPHDGLHTMALHFRPLRAPSAPVSRRLLIMSLVVVVFMVALEPGPHARHGARRSPRVYNLGTGLSGGGHMGSKADMDDSDVPRHRRKGPYVIGVTGGTASGKTTVCETIIKKMGLSPVVILPMDRFYRQLTKKEIANIQNHNFDHPDAFDWKLFRSTLDGLVARRNVKVPRYDFKTHSRENRTDSFQAADVVIVEGILVLYDPQIRKMMDMKIFVDTDADLRLARRIQRDVARRGRTVDEVLDQYIGTVKRSYDDFIHPTKRHADLVIPQGGHNTVAISLMVEHIRTQLKNLHLEKVVHRRSLESNGHSDAKANCSRDADER